MSELLALVFMWYMVQLTMYQMAKHNFIWTIVNEGEARIVCQNGIPVFVFMNFAGHKLKGTKGAVSRLSFEDCDVVPDVVPTGKKANWARAIRNWRPISILHSILFPASRIHFIGFPPWWKLHSYEFAWVNVTPTEDKTEGNENKEEFKRHKEKIQWIYVKRHVYAFFMKGVELADQIPHDFWLILEIQVRNPLKALFRIHRWLDSILELAGTRARDILGDFTSQEVAGGEGKGKSGGENATIIEIDKKLTEEFRLNDQKPSEMASLLNGEYGVEIHSMRIRSADPPENLRALILKEVEERQKGRGAIALAEGEGAAEIIRAKAKKTAIETIDEAARGMSENARHMFTLETIKGIPNVTLISKDLPIVVPTNGKV